jgi:hypothetical protein
MGARFSNTKNIPDSLLGCQEESPDCRFYKSLKCEDIPGILGTFMVAG